MNTSLQLRSAQEQDLPRLMLLLGQVLAVHHQGRPDLFRPTGSKYSPQQLRQLLTRKDRPIYVAADADGQVLGYAFCMLQETRDDTVLLDRRTLYLDDLCVDEACRGQGVGSAERA